MKKYPRVLVIDDSRSFRFFVRDSLKQFKNVVFIEAHDGDDGLMQFKKEIPKLTLLDVNMPKINGLIVLKAIKKINPQSKVIITSAYINDQISINEIISAGAISFLPKPLNKILLMKTINDHLTNSFG